MLAQDGWTALHGAAVEGELGAARLLMERGASSSAVTTGGRTPMDCAHNDATRIVMLITQHEAGAAASHRHSTGAAPARGASLDSARSARRSELAAAAADAAAGGDVDLPPHVAAWLHAIASPLATSMRDLVVMLTDVDEEAALLAVGDLDGARAAAKRRRSLVRAAAATILLATCEDGTEVHGGGSPRANCPETAPAEAQPHSDEPTTQAAALPDVCS